MRKRKFWFTISEVLVVLTLALMLPVGTVAWSKYKVLHRFNHIPDGDSPSALIFDAAGNLYGTTSYGGADGVGNVFKLAPNPDGSWTESVLYSFCSATVCSDGAGPVAGVIFDGAGNLYGTTPAGGLFVGNCGDYGCGTVFRLKPNSDGNWTEGVLYSFTALNGYGPVDRLVFDRSGNLYGTTR